MDLIAIVPCWGWGIALVANLFWLRHAVRNLGKTLDTKFYDLVDERVRCALEKKEGDK